MIKKSSKFKMGLSRLFWCKALIFGLMWGFSGCENDHSLFTDYARRNTPLYLCNGFSEGVKYRIPENIDCPPLPNLEKTTVPIKITTFWIDNSIKPISAMECYARSETLERYSGWFRGEYNMPKITTKVFVSESNCRDMIKSQLSPDGRPLSRLREGQFGTNQHNVPEYSYWFTTKTTNVNYYYSLMDITVSKSGETITTGAQVMEECSPSSGVCPTIEGIVIWDRVSIPVCRIKEGGTAWCAKAGDRIVCPDFEFVFTGVTQTNICDDLVTIGYNDQRVFISSEIKGEITNTTMSTKEIRTILNLEKPRKVTRDAGVMKSGFMSDVNFISDAEFNARGAYILDVIRQGYSYDIQNLFDGVCRSQQQIYNLARFMAESGSPTALARMLTNTNSYRARLAGDVISLWKCDEVYEYYFLPRNNCTIEWPINYISKHDKKTGYLVPLSHEIVSEPTFVNCPAGSFYFEMEDNVYLLTNRTAAGDLPFLPNAAKIADYRGIPDLTLKAQGYYSSEDISGQNTLQQMFRRVSSRMWVDQAIEAKQKGMELNLPQLNAINDSKMLTVGDIIDKIYWMMVSIGIIAFTILVGFVIIYIDPILRIAKAGWAAVKKVVQVLYGLIRAFCRMCANVAQKKAIRSQAPNDDVDCEDSSLKPELPTTMQDLVCRCPITSHADAPTYEEINLPSIPPRATYPFNQLNSVS